jgi:cytochrome c553
MRLPAMIALLALFIVVAAATWLGARGPTPAEGKQIAAVLDDPAPADEPAAFAHCASCHLHDGSGRPDGSIPRLNGQRKAVLQNKLFRIRSGLMRLPVMDPFARTLQPAEIAELAAYLSELPDTAPAPSTTSREELATGAASYAEHCASCHGEHGEGHDGLFASRLCGQYAGYLERRLQEVADGRRGDADALMRGVLEGAPTAQLGPIVKWLSEEKGCEAP